MWNRPIYFLSQKNLCGSKIDVIHQITPIEFRTIGDYGKDSKISNSSADHLAEESLC